MKWVLRILLYFFGLLAVLVVLSYLTNHDYIWTGIRETWLRGWKNAQIDDLQFRDHVRTIPASSNPQPWPESSLAKGASLSKEDVSWLKETQTASFLVILHDSLVAEEYLMGHDEETLTNSFSMAKSITAMAVGLAVDEGLVELDASVGTYIDRLGDGASADLTVEQLLQMRSCIPFGESYKNPFGFQAKAYYRDDNRELLQGYEVEGTPGTAFKYQGGNTMLLAEMLDEVRDGNLSEDIAEGLWERVGAEYDAKWGLDMAEEEGGVERSFAQFYATTRDFARFGQLLLDTGAWKGEQLISKDYITKMLTPINQLTNDVDVSHYGYQIWLGMTDDGRPFSLMEGLRGQMVISIPSLDMVVVRTGYAKSEVKKRELPVEAYHIIDMARRLTTTD